MFWFINVAWRCRRAETSRRFYNIQQNFVSEIFGPDEVGLCWLTVLVRHALCPLAVCIYM